MSMEKTAAEQARAAVDHCDVARVATWLAEPTKPANLAFTAGPERQMAYHIEALRDRAERVEAAEADIARVREALVDALDTAEEGWSYASDYFKTKWGAAESLQRIRDAIAATELRPK